MKLIELRAGLLGLGLAAGLVATPALAQDTAPADLPSARSIVDAAIEAMGGREAFEAIESTTTKAEMEIPMAGMTMEMEIYSGKNGEFLMRQIMPGMGEMGMGYDGQHGWMQNPMTGQYDLLDESDLEQGRQQVSMHTMLLDLDEEDMEGVETVGRTTFGEQDAWKLSMANEDGEQFAYFSTDTDLILGMEVAQGPMMVTLRFNEWEEVGDVRLFKQVVIDQGGMEITMNFTEITLNNVDPSVFELPEEVADLVAEMDDEASSRPDDG